MSEFDSMGLRPEILAAIGAMGFEAPTPVQARVIPMILAGTRDLVTLAGTGTGKTAAFGLPLLSRLDPADRKTRVLVLCPTRELCVQIAKDLGNFSKGVPGLDALAVYGGSSVETQLRALRKGAQVVVATPGRCLDLMERGKLEADAVETLVLDEADEMLNMGFKEELDAILSRAPAGKRTLLFSATMPREVEAIASSYLRDPETAVLGERGSGSADVEHVYHLVRATDRYLALKRIADANPDIYAIVFCRTRAGANEVAGKLIEDGYPAEALHGELTQQQRDFTMQKFRSRALRILVATDVAARGIDVSDLTHVVNYELPDELEVYTHRSGRTGRAGKKGICVSILHARETYKIGQIQRSIGRPLVRARVPSGREICERQLLHLAAKVKSVAVSDAEIEPFLPAVRELLGGMDAGEMLKRFLSVEFNRFLEYYSEAPELDLPERAERPQGAAGRQGPAGEMASFFINVGSVDGIHPQSLLVLINRHTRNRDIAIGKMKILHKCSFFEAAKQYEMEVIRAFQGASFERRRLVVDRADSVGGGPRGARPPFDADRAAPRRADKRDRPDKRPYRPARG